MTARVSQNLSSSSHNLTQICLKIIPKCNFKAVPSSAKLNNVDGSESDFSQINQTIRHTPDVAFEKPTSFKLSRKCRKIFRAQPISNSKLPSVKVIKFPRNFPILFCLSPFNRLQSRSHTYFAVAFHVIQPNTFNTFFDFPQQTTTRKKINSSKNI